LTFILFLVVNIIQFRSTIWTKVEVIREHMVTAPNGALHQIYTSPIFDNFNLFVTYITKTAFPGGRNIYRISSFAL